MIGGDLGRIWCNTPDISPVNIGPQKFTGNGAVGQAFNLRALISRDLALFVPPKANRLWGHIQRPCKGRDAAKVGDGVLNWVHANYSTRVELKNLHVCLFLFLHLFTLGLLWR